MDTTILHEKEDKRSLRILAIIIISISAAVSLACLYKQFRFYRTPVEANDSIYDYPTINSECTILDITWLNRDYDDISGYLSIDDSPITIYPTRIVFYRDDGSYYSSALKARNYYSPEAEAEYSTKDLTFSLFRDQEYIADAGEPTDRTWFYTLLVRENSMRNNTKIGFLIKIDGVTYFTDTGIPYKYPD